MHLLLRALRERAAGGADVRFLVAPFEADAQLAYMARRGLIDVVISEVSEVAPPWWVSGHACLHFSSSYSPH